MKRSVYSGRCALLAGALLLTGPAGAASDLAWLDAYHIVWDSQGSNSAGSMPLGGGNLGLNVWAENGDVLFYIGSPDSHDEQAVLRKLERIRLTFTPSPFAGKFKQTLDLHCSTVTIEGVNEKKQAFKLELWVDAFKPVIHIGSVSGAAVDCVATYETWVPQVKAQVAGDLQWYHRHDPAKDQRAGLIKAQGLEEVASQVPVPSTNLTFGGRLSGRGFVAAGEAAGEYMGTPYRLWKLKTEKAATELNLSVVICIAQDNTVADLEPEVVKLKERSVAAADADRKATLQWWGDSWGRSRIVISPRSGTPDPKQSAAWGVGSAGGIELRAGDCAEVPVECDRVQVNLARRGGGR